MKLDNAGALIKVTMYKVNAAASLLINSLFIVYSN